MRSASRLEALRARMSEVGVEAFVSVHPANMTYLTGFDGVFDADPGAACVVLSDTAWLVADRRYDEAARAASADTAWEVRTASGPPLDEACELVEGWDQTAVDDSLAHGRFATIAERLGGRLRAVHGWVEELRRVKDPAELERMEQAARLADAAIEHAGSVLRAGVSERDAALEIEVFMRRAGSEGVAFAPIVASGPGSARPHALPGERELEPGDLVIVDIGARVGGYCSDITRTFAIGRAGQRERELHAAVLEAQLAGVAAVRDGVSCAQADSAAREVLAGLGLGDAFGHGSGHGVGLEIHEAPSIGARSQDTLASGEVVTVEPGAYLPGFGGVRIEDLVVVGDGGCRCLTRAPKELVEIG